MLIHGGDLLPRNSNNSLHATQIYKVNGIDCLGTLVGVLDDALQGRSV